MRKNIYKVVFLLLNYRNQQTMSVTRVKSNIQELNVFLDHFRYDG